MEQTNQTPAVVQPENEDRDVVMFLESLNIFQEGPNTLRANKRSVTGAKAGAQKFLQEVELNGGAMSAELDDKAKNLLVKIGTTLKAMKERREPFTQLAAALSKQFTSLEADLDQASKTPNDFTRIQGMRNSWAKWCIEEGERQRKEAERIAEVEKEKARVIGWITEKIGTLLVDYLFRKRQRWQTLFNDIELAGFDQSAENLRKADTVFVRAKLGEVIRYDLPGYPRLNEEQLNVARIKAHEDFDFDGWIEGHDREMAELKQSLVDRLPAKKQELEEAAERARMSREAEERRQAAEALRQQQEREEKEAERQRQEAISQANTAEKERLEAEAAVARQQAETARLKREEEQRQENERLEALRLENERLESERRERERLQQEEIQTEKAEADRLAREKAEFAQSSMVAGSLFDQVSATAVLPTGPEARQGYEIIVKHPAGWVEIFQFWYQKKGVTMAPDKMGSVKLESMKTFCESAAKDTDKQKGEKISSKYLEYVLDVKAINRKEKKKEDE